MFPYTGDYIEHIKGDENNFKYYTFTPRPLMNGDMFKMDDELTALLIEAHHNIGFLEGLVKYAPNKDAFGELMLLKECVYSRMIDYASPTFQEVLVSRGRGKGDITPIIDLELAYKMSENKKITAPNLSKLCGIALYGNVTDDLVDIRNRQTFLSNVRTNLKSYNPTAPDAVLPALTDISAYLYNNEETDSLIKAALVHYQFEMIHPFEQYNGIIGRIIVPMVLRDMVNGALPLICLSEYLYHNKNEYFDLLRTTQYSGGYIRWIKFFVNAVGQVAKHASELMIQYEQYITEDWGRLMDAGTQPKSILLVYEYLKRRPIVSTSFVAKDIGLSFNSVSKALHILQEYGIVLQMSADKRNRIWVHRSLSNETNM